MTHQTRSIDPKTEMPCLSGDELSRADCDTIHGWLIATITGDEHPELLALLIWLQDFFDYSDKDLQEKMVEEGWDKDPIGNTENILHYLESNIEAKRKKQVKEKKGNLVINPIEDKDVSEINTEMAKKCFISMDPKDQHRYIDWCIENATETICDRAIVI